MKSWHKRGQVEDFTDLLIIIIGGVFLLFFLQLFVVKTIDDKNKEAVVQMERTVKVSDYLVEKRGELERGKELDREKMSREIKNIRNPPPPVK